MNYTYDGDGDRVEKSNGKIYWYGAGSEILDESDLSGNVTDEYIFFGGKRIARRDSSGNIVYYAADHLGTSRVVTNATGGILDQSDFYPFGGERVLSASSGNTYKFEGKERDTETNNDDFGARYYSSQFGRWLSPDWSAIPAPVPYANLSNPQTLNLYAMVSDNPETFADLDGHVLSTQQPDGSSISFDYSADAGQQQAAEQQAAQNNPANSQNATLNVGGTKVDVTLDKPSQGVTIEANPQGCENCSWAQTVTRTGEGKEATKTDREVKDQPLYPSTERRFYDSPSTKEGGSGKFTATTTLGIADKENKTFKVIGSITWGYSMDKGGNVTVSCESGDARGTVTFHSCIETRQSKLDDWSLGL